MRCESVAPYLTARASGELEDHTRTWVDSHLQSCVSCSAVVDRSARATRALRMLEPDAIEPPAGLANAVMARIQEQDSVVTRRRLLPLPLVAGEQLAPRLGEVGRVLVENKETIVNVAGTAAAAAGVAWLAWKALRTLRNTRPANSALHS
ncbi:MAG: zf-HC2 domain-containing protein [Actinomycetota bacterium]